MKNNIKLFFVSLINNNSAIDAARKKPWYAALIIFFISLILSVLPSTISKLQENGDKYFEKNSFLTAEASTQYAKDLQAYGDDVLYIFDQDGKKVLAHNIKETTEEAEDRWENCFVKKYTFTQEKEVVFKFAIVNDNDFVDVKNLYTDEKISYFIFTSTNVYIRVLDPNNNERIAAEMDCRNAYAGLTTGDFKNSYVEGANLTETTEKTWANWKNLIKNFFNQTRVTAALSVLGITAAVNASISLVMGLMIWILTRGKNNPYRLFTFWESFKISFWCGMAPAIITASLGFLITQYASMMFVMLLGVRIMWLTMKSLRPDGSGYAAE